MPLNTPGNWLCLVFLLLSASGVVCGTYNNSWCPASVNLVSGIGGLLGPPIVKVVEFRWSKAEDRTWTGRTVQLERCTEWVIISLCRLRSKIDIAQQRHATGSLVRQATLDDVLAYFAWCWCGGLWFALVAVLYTFILPAALFSHFLYRSSGSQVLHHPTAFNEIIRCLPLALESYYHVVYGVGSTWFFLKEGDWLGNLMTEVLCHSEDKWCKKSPDGTIDEDSCRPAYNCGAGTVFLMFWVGFVGGMLTVALLWIPCSIGCRWVVSHWNDRFPNDAHYPLLECHCNRGHGAVENAQSLRNTMATSTGAESSGLLSVDLGNEPNGAAAEGTSAMDGVSSATDAYVQRTDDLYDSDLRGDSDIVPTPRQAHPSLDPNTPGGFSMLAGWIAGQTASWSSWWMSGETPDEFALTEVSGRAEESVVSHIV